MKQKVYISGPMTGFKDFNRPAFNEVARVLTDLGYETLNPADGPLPIGTSWEDYMRADITMLMQADIIYMLPGWERSKGARIEFNLAVDLKMEVVFEKKNNNNACCENPQVADVNTVLIQGRYCVNCGHIHKAE